eukprot:CAMPEP_0197665092 /NCGR_PEP_ID=MMETSP1338-20131121/59026_1 /TAXON_ID=43686 ORGANISM="Pelagodinium beii, Strain RCC1491" /NCGR_SAMPLE_ID=MMETSP1338 /ASSEMBLY_ACC=CAM_ASM_000754 /LENGTH=505 /DNA_ID=CAMNT_0043243847 /DNA_START=267 /DNA_END=1784 /DNA_ORIENTATION=+
MAMKDRVLLMPKVADRGALLWSKKAIESSDYELLFTLSGQMPKDSTDQDGALAFWLSPDDFAAGFDEKAVITRAMNSAEKDWKVGMEDVGLKLLSNKPNFKGLAVVFLIRDGRQTIVTAWNSGATSFNAVSDLLKDSSAKIVNSDWLHFGTQVKVRVSPDGSIIVSKRDFEPGRTPGSVWSWAPDGEKVEGDFSLTPEHKVTWKEEAPAGSWELLRGGRMNVTINQNSYLLRLEGNHAIQEMPVTDKPGVAFYGGKGVEDVPWQQMALFPAATIKREDGGFFIGFSGYSGSKSPMEAELNTLETINHDPNVVGEDIGDIQEAWKEALEDEARYVDKASQKEALERLAKLLGEHVAQGEKLDENFRASFAQLESRLQDLSADLANFLAATEAWSTEKDQFNPEVVKEHVGKVKTLLTQGKEVHNAKFVQVERAATELKDSQGKSQMGEAGKVKVQAVVEQTKLVKESAAAGSTQSSILLLIIVGSVGGLGYLFLTRMRYYEKKHFI